MKLYLGLALMAGGFAELIWFLRTNAPKHFAAQAMVFGEMGLIFLAMALIPNQTAAATVVAILGLGVLFSVWLQMKLLRQWRRGQDVHHQF